MQDKNKTVFVGMSGGIDSSVTATLLKDQGYKVIGVTMSIWDGQLLQEYKGKHACFGPDEEADIKKAKDICSILGIEHRVIDLKKHYSDVVLLYFSDEYKEGRTPNPCIVCNAKMKFGLLMDKVLEGYSSEVKFATGHYVRTTYDEKSKRYLLLKGQDDTKDQSYFLYRLSQSQLSRCLFPLGEYQKHDIRLIAKEKNLGFEKIPESQNFISGDYSQIIDIVSEEGDIITSDGKIVGKHKGYCNYTIGQRKGLGVQHPEPLYVVAIKKEENQIVVGTKKDLYKDTFRAKDLNWIAFDSLSSERNVFAKIRYQHSEEQAYIEPISRDEVLVKFQNPQLAITPGQSVVFYDEDIVLGGGIIE
jgi:tRNA-uridine 2-sulfurtransferase